MSPDWNRTRVFRPSARPSGRSTVIDAGRVYIPRALDCLGTAVPAVFGWGRSCGDPGCCVRCRRGQLLNETREYGTWADWLGVPRHTFVSVFGAVIARGLDYRETFQVFKPGFDLDQQRQARADAGKPEWFGEDDLYTGCASCPVGPPRVGCLGGHHRKPDGPRGGLLRGLDLPTDFIATSDDWGVAKPDVAFFDKVVEAAGCSAEQIIYVGDRIDNDITPAMRVGMRTAYIQRGPWGWIHKDRQDVKELSDWRILSLSELSRHREG